MTSSSHAFAFSTRALLMAILAATINVGGVAMLFSWSPSAGAAPVAQSLPASDCPKPTAVQRHILVAASRGAGALRDYIWITRGVHQFDLVETVQWIDGYRAASARCEPRSADGDDGSTHAGDRLEPGAM